MEPAWRRIDLHIHTPGSTDYQEPRVGYLELLQRAEARGLDIMAFTDHNSVAGYTAMEREIEYLTALEAGARLTPEEARRLQEYRRLREKILVLPGFEFTATFGFHILGLFPPETSVRKLEHILLQLNIPEEKLDQGTSEVGATTDVLRAYEIIADAGGLVIAAHVNSTHGVAMIGLGFGGQTKIAYTQDPNLHALEVTDLESASRRATARFFNGSKPEYPRHMHCIQGSDAHRPVRDPQRPEKNLGIGDRCTEVLIPDVSFAALKALFASTDFGHTRPFRPSNDPFDPLKSARAEGNTIVQSFHDAPGPPRARVKVLLKDVVAFANTNGGVLYVGASANPNGPIAGVEGAAELAELIRVEAARQIVPPLVLDVEMLTSEDKQVLVVTVPKGTDTPYALDPGYIYVRQEGETTLALRDEIVQLVRAAAAPATIGLDPGSALPARSSPPVPVAPPARVVSMPAPAASTNGVVPARGAGTPPAPNPRISQQVAVQQAAAAERERQQERTPVPRTGVEIIASAERNGVLYHTVRDLRNRRAIRNVTRESARRLWRYAILQAEGNTFRPEDVRWGAEDGRFGFWKGYRQPEGMRRYNLIYREQPGAGNGHGQNGAGDDAPEEAGERLRIFYGVTEDGIDDRWRSVLPDDSELTEIYYDEPHLPGEPVEALSAASSDQPAVEPAPAPVVASQEVVAPVESPVAVPDLASSDREEEPGPVGTMEVVAPTFAPTPPPETIEVAASPEEAPALLVAASLPGGQAPEVPAVPVAIEEIPVAIEAPAPPKRRRAPRRRPQPSVEEAVAPEAAVEVALEPSPEPAPITALAAETVTPEATAANGRRRRRGGRAAATVETEAVATLEPAVVEFPLPVPDVRPEDVPAPEVAPEGEPAKRPVRRRRSPRKGGAEAGTDAVATVEASNDAREPVGATLPARE